VFSKVWDVETGQCIETVYGAAWFLSVAVTPDGRMICAADGAGNVWMLEYAVGEEKPPEEEGKPLRLFFSYSHKDEEFRDALETHLALLKREGTLDTWHDRKITAGDEWKRQIDHHLQEANIILLLISPDFIASDYCYDIEMKRALERHEKGEAVVIPVIIRPTDWYGAPFGELQALPKDAKPVTTWENRDEAWLDVARGIRRVAERLRKSKR